MKTLIRLLAILILVSPGRSVQGPRLHSWCWQRHHRECWNIRRRKARSTQIQ